MIGKRRWGWIGLAFVITCLGLLVLIGFSSESHKQRVRAGYDAIRAGMSRSEIRRLMQGAGLVMFTDISNAEVMHVDGRFMVAVIYEPDPLLPSTANPSGLPADDWVAKEKMFIELGRGGPLDDVLVGLGLRTPRTVDSDRMPRSGTNHTP
jgi:hypothetical protein